MSQFPATEYDAKEVFLQSLFLKKVHSRVIETQVR